MSGPDIRMQAEAGYIPLLPLKSGQPRFLCEYFDYFRYSVTTACYLLRHFSFIKKYLGYSWLSIAYRLLDKKAKILWKVKGLSLDFFAARFREHACM